MTDTRDKIITGILCDKLLRFRGPKPDHYATMQEWAMAEAKKIVQIFEPDCIGRRV